MYPKQTKHSPIICIYLLKCSPWNTSQITKMREKLCRLLQSGQLPWSKDWCWNSRSIITDWWWFSNILGAVLRSFQKKELKRYYDLALVLGTLSHLLQILSFAAKHGGVKPYLIKSFHTSILYQDIQQTLDWFFSFTVALLLNKDFANRESGTFLNIFEGRTNSNKWVVILI